MLRDRMNAPVHFDRERGGYRRGVARVGIAGTPARDFGAYSVTFDGKALDAGETIEAAPGVKLHRRC